MKTKNFKNKDTLRDILDNVKCNSIHITGLSEGKKRHKGPEKLLDKIVAKNLPNETFRPRKPRVPSKMKKDTHQDTL